MKKLLKSALILGLAALLLFTCAACKDDPDPTETTTAIDPYALKTDVTTAETGTSEDISNTEPTSTEITSAEVSTTKPAENSSVVTATTETPATTEANKKPGTKAEILAYINTAMQKLRGDKPGYTFTDRMIIDETKVSSENGFINTVAPTIIGMAKSAWANWSDPVVTAKGADHSKVPPKTDLQDNWIKSATCTESGANYVIRVNIVQERVATDRKSVV